jgi:hypothetical protein
MLFNELTADQLITYCSLRGDVSLHKELKTPAYIDTRFWVVEMQYKDTPVRFQYCENEDGSLTFVKGTMRIRDPDLGTEIVEIYGFKHLLKTLGLWFTSA